jgi:hypothetical protein
MPYQEIVAVVNHTISTPTTWRTRLIKTYRTGFQARSVVGSIHQFLSSWPNSNPIGVLGCTGSAGQRFILLLAEHPHFKLRAVGASSRSAGRNTRIPLDGSKRLQWPNMSVNWWWRSARRANSSIVMWYSGLDADVAGEIGSPPVS